MTQTETSELPDVSLRRIRDPQRMYSADKLNLSQLSGERMNQLQPLRANDTSMCWIAADAYFAQVLEQDTNGYFEEDQVL